MMMNIVIALLLWTGLFAQETSTLQANTNQLTEKIDNLRLDFDVRLKAKLVAKDVLQVKVLIKNIIKKEENERLKLEPHYVTHIVVKIGKNIVFDATISDEIAKSQMLKFFILDVSSEDEVELILTDNKDYTSHYFSKIKRTESFPKIQGTEQLYYQSKVKKLTSYKNDTDVIDYKKTNPDVWKAISFDAAINALYGKTKVTDTTNKIYSFLGNDFAQVESGSPAILKVHSKKNLESIAVLTSSGKYVTKAIIRIPKADHVGYEIENRYGPSEFKEGLIYFEFPEVYLKPDQKVVLVSKSRDGNVYRQTLILKLGSPEQNYPMSIFIEL